jgi:putative hemolysin
MGEGSENPLGLDQDPFDMACQHINVYDQHDQVIGTYRMQTGKMAAQNLGYYFANEFEMEPFEPIRGEILELGRACIAREHRKPGVLSYLWSGIADYAGLHGVRYLIGCSSIHTVEPADGNAVWEHLERKGFLVDSRFATAPLAHGSCGNVPPSPKLPEIPKLFGLYLTIGAKVCSRPFIDSSFKTIDFLTLLDLKEVPPRVAQRYLKRVKIGT